MVIDRSENIGVSLPSRFTPVEVVYYDDYAFLDSLSTEERQKYLPQDITGADEAEPLLMGVPTGGKRALSNGSEKMLLYVNYYDRLGRVVQTCEDNILGKVDYNGTTYSFTGMPVTAEKLFNHSSSSVSHLVYTNTYDALDRNLMTTLSVNESAAQLLQTNTYDSLGRLQNAAMGNNAASVSYGYNLRGWATGITSNQFSQQIYYQYTTGGSTPCFNGNISSMAWMQSGANGNSSKSGRYNYTYDSLDRLTAAAFADNDNRSFSSQYQYDLHGNVTNIQRSGVAERITDGAAETVTYGVIDNVTLSYSGNRLQVADDVADALVYDGAMDFTDGANEVEEYAYDANGNMTKDLNRGIESITYDWNNMPREITFTSGAKTRYTYDAAGRKLRAEYITPLAASANYATRPTPPIVPPLTLYDLSTVDYHGDCVLRNNSLERVLTPNGYIASDTLHYFIKDYQGNVRCVVRHDGAVKESNEYYPYGGIFAVTASVQPYKYGSKELDRMHGLDLYDSEARWYDSLLGRTTTMDPLAEKYYSLSPYLWCAGNPVKNIDLHGDTVAVLYKQDIIGHLALLIQNEKGKWVYYSYNGIPIFEFTHGSLGGKPYHDLGVKTFDSPEEFMNSTYNREGNEEEVGNNEVNNYGYDEAYTIPTDSKQDNKIRSAFLSEAKKPYYLFSHQCAQVVQNALSAGNIKSIDVSFLYYDDDYPKENVPFMPLRTFCNIININPKGKIIKKK